MQPGEKSENMGETALQKARRVKKEGKGMLEVPLLPMEVHSGPDVHQQFGGHHTDGGPHTCADGCPKEAVTAWKATLELAPGRICGERSPCWCRFDDRTCDPMGTH